MLTNHIFHYVLKLDYLAYRCSDLEYFLSSDTEPQASIEKWQPNFHFFLSFFVVFNFINYISVTNWAY